MKTWRYRTLAHRLPFLFIRGNDAKHLTRSGDKPLPRSNSN
ncbi:hypothetical protein RE6C_05460 [Rhodopirellula europaea 6C]|uniref:Uncharacterized protein n=1 Tax=Rhodopirellula europaea 6C TaxID=1263867 RepID=M2AM75_9BACT|nr:hypothetical protein RE6C_05460 [Rhodopirellula europaea 6C]